MKTLLKTTILSLGLSSVLLAGMADDPLRYKVTLDALQIEHSDQKVFTWDTNAYVGYDLNKLYIFSEGEKVKNSKSESENQLVLSKAIAPYWDIQYGLAYDKGEENSKTWAVLAIQGMSSYFFETRTALLIDKKGGLSLRSAAQNDYLITQKLKIGTSAEVIINSKDDDEMQTKKGLANLSLGLNLKYEIIREIAPYIGISYSKNFGATNDLNNLNETNLVTGVSIWF